MTFTYVDAQSQSRTTDLTSAVVTDPSVSLATTIDAGRRKVGYILFDSFIDTSNAALDQAFTRFGSQGVTELVIDERYNGGGEVSVAQHLASLIAGNSLSGKTLATLTFNDKHPDQNQTISFETVTHPLDLTRVFFITTDATASASELTINALAPYIRVVTVGRATFGKPVGENGFDVCTNVLYPITFKIANARGFGDYFDGLPATCPAVDDTGHPLGDPAEASLATALGYVQGHGCGAAATSAEVAQALAEAEARTRGPHVPLRVATARQRLLSGGIAQRIDPPLAVAALEAKPGAPLLEAPLERDQVRQRVELAVHHHVAHPEILERAERGRVGEAREGPVERRVPQGTEAAVPAHGLLPVGHRVEHVDGMPPVRARDLVGVEDRHLRDRERLAPAPRASDRSPGSRRHTAGR